MQWNKQRKITAAIVTLAGLAFAADQLFNSGGPESAAAAGQTSAAPASAARTAPAASANQASPQHPAALLARRLEQATSEAGYTSVGDAFRPPLSWFHKPDSTPTTMKAPEATPVVEAGIQFKAKHRLIGVMRSGPAGSNQGLAVIAGPSGSLTVRVGETIDGVMLAGVEDGRIRMTENGHEFCVELPRPGLGNTASAQ
jgi:hypothetical protein